MGSERPEGLAQLHRNIVLIAFLLMGVGCVENQDPYAKNPNERDPRARPRDLRTSPAPDPSEVLAEFKSLKRPIIERYIEYAATTQEAIGGHARTYTHIVLTDEACSFINHHTFEELVRALHPLIHDAYWSGDVMALLSTAAWSPATIGRALFRAEYHSPDAQGTWPKLWKEYSDKWSIGRTGTRFYIGGGQLRERTPEELEIDRKDIEAMRRGGLWPKDEKTD